MTVGRSRRICLAVRLVLPAIATVILSLPAAAQLVRIDPEKHAGRRGILIGESRKAMVYHRTSQEQPAEFSVQGPVPLRVIARHYSPGRGLVTMRLRIEIEEDGEDEAETAVIHLDPRPSNTARRRDGTSVGVLRRGEIRIPAGLHRVRIYPENTTRSAVVRVFKGTPTRSAASWVPFAPHRFEQAVILHGPDSETTYYRFNKETPVGLEVLGPLRLRVTTRLDFDEVAGSTQSYVVRVLLDGEPWQVFPMSSRTSPNVFYPDLPEIAPGIAREFTVSIPQGRHDVEMYLVSTTAGGASARIRVPARELRASEPQR